MLYVWLGALCGNSVIKPVLYKHFSIGDEEPNNGNLSPDQNSSSPVRIILQTKNADELFERALKFGATQICPMTTEDDWKIGKLKDPFGHIWEIGYSQR